MARCLQCNKFMLFRSSSGYCSSCEVFIQQKKAHEERARLTQGVQSVNKELPVKKQEEQLSKQPQTEKASDTNVVGKYYLCANTDQKISADMIPPVFNMHCPWNSRLRASGNHLPGRTDHEHRDPGKEREPYFPGRRLYL